MSWIPATARETARISQQMKLIRAFNDGARAQARAQAVPRVPPAPRPAPVAPVKPEETKPAGEKRRSRAPTPCAARKRVHRDDVREEQ
ncbi:hypothetical protein Q8F55_005470 [Vanrija albida]|uniref:Uncharacterized protein n=1 Tax=Vanrija albida TaxID=181172 RepID=A0ABR3Q221_9TREE